MSQAQQDSYAKHKPDQAEAQREFATDHDSIVTVLKFALLSFLSQDISTNIHLLVVWLRSLRSAVTINVVVLCYVACVAPKLFLRIHTQCRGARFSLLVYWRYRLCSGADSVRL